MTGEEFIASVRKFVDEKTSRELRDEWLPRPFALSPASYYSAPYPGTERIAAMKAELSRALKATSEKERSE